jgi:hypothetical protein
MSWLKRNLYFLIGSVGAVLLLGLSGWYLYAKWQLNNGNEETLTKAYDDLKKFSEAKPNPGNDKVDNIKRAREQQAGVSAVIQQAGKYFALIPATPAPANSRISSADFAAALRQTIAQLGRNAADASVALPPKYNFSFEAQILSVKFAPGSLEPLAAQLGEVKTICGVLFQAKINSLDNLRRERVSEDDLKGPQSDCLDEKSVTNDLAVLTPYEVTFHCFSAELAGVLAGFANDPHGMVVKTINVEPGTITASADQSAPAPGYAPAGVAPPGVTPAGKGGLPIMLDEKQLKVTLMLNIVKLLPRK